MSTLAIVLVAFGVLVLILVVFALVGLRRRDRRQAGAWARNVAEVDAALEQARAADRGWDPGVMESAVRGALEESRPGWPYEAVYLVLVDDRPGTEEDRAHYVAVGDGGDEARVVLARQGDHWSAERVD